MLYQSWLDAEKAVPIPCLSLRDHVGVSPGPPPAGRGPGRIAMGKTSKKERPDGDDTDAWQYRVGPRRAPGDSQPLGSDHGSPAVFGPRPRGRRGHGLVEDLVRCPRCDRDGRQRRI